MKPTHKDDLRHTLTANEKVTECFVLLPYVVINRDIYLKIRVKIIIVMTVFCAITILTSFFIILP